MAKRLNRLLAAIAAAATLATGVAGSAWADTADGKVDFDVKAADGTTLDGMDVGLYKVGDWNMDALERGSDGALTGIHAASADDRSGFTVAQDGSQSAVEPHGRAAKAAESAGIAVSDGTDPLDAAWALDPSDSHVKAFAEAYAGELEDAKAAADATVKGAGRVRLDPGVYVAVRGSDAETAVLAGTATADGSVVRGRDGMGSATLTGDAVKSDGGGKGLSGLLGKAKRGILSLFGLNSGIAVQDMGGSGGINGHGGGAGSGMEWRWWFQDTPNRDGNAENVAMQWPSWNSYSTSRVRSDFDSACDLARQDAVNRHGHDKGYYRIVAVGAFIGNVTSGGSGKTTYHGNPGNNALKNAFWSAYNGGGRNEMNAKTNDVDAYRNYVGTLADNATNGQVRVACVVLGRDEPGKPEFSLNVSTTRTARDPNNPGASVDYRENDKAWLADAVNVTATGGDWPNGGTVNVLTQLCYDPTPDGINPDGTLQADNASDRVCWDQRRDWTLSGGLPEGHSETFNSPWFKPDEAPQGMTMGSVKGGRGWAYGRYWFYTEITAVGKTDLKEKVLHYGYRDPKEGFTRTYVTAKTSVEVKDGSDFKTASDGMPTSNGWTVRDDLIGTSTPIRDHISLAGSYPVFNLDTPSGDASYMYNQSRIRIDQRLCYRPLGATDATPAKQSTVKRITLNKSTGQVNGTLNEFTPSDLSMTTWKPGEYWFNTNIPGHLTADGRSLNDDVPTGTDGNVTIVRTFHESGLDVAAERFKISQPKAGLSIETKAVSDGAGRGNAKPVHDSITLTNTGSTAVKVKPGAISVTLNYPGQNGRKTATRTVAKDVSVPAGKSTTVSASSPEFTPDDLGMKDGWHANLRPDDRYWFDVSIDAGSVTDANGNTVALTTSAKHDGSADKNEQFTVEVRDNSASTKAADTFAWSGGAGKVHDDIALDFDEVSTLNVTSTLNYAADTTATKADSSKSKNATLNANATSAGPAFTPSDFGWKAWKAGRYWYDLTIPAQVGCPKEVSLNGVAIAAERWVAAEPKAGLSTKTDAPAGMTDASSDAVHDVVNAVTTGYADGSRFSVTLKLRYSASGSSTADRTASATFDAAVNGETVSPGFTPAMFGWKTWHVGRYWFDLSAVDPNGKTVDVPGANDPNERFDVSEHKSGAFTTRTDAPTGMTDLSDTSVHDVVTAATTGYPAGTTFDATLKLSHAPAGSTTADRTKTLAFKVASDGDTTSPAFTPAMFDWKTWHVGRYWFDLTVTMDGKTVSVPGTADPNERFDVSNHTTKATLAITTQAAKGTASTTNADPVHDTVRLSASGAALTVARVHVRLNYPKADGTTATAVKDTGSITVPKNGSKSIDSPTFTPADLGLGGLWADNAKASDHYWFDVWVDKADVALSGDTGAMALSGALSHDGKADATERFRLDRQSGKATTTAAGTFDRAGGMAATHDTLHLAFPGAKTLKVTSTLHYAASGTAVKADASKAKTATVTANGDVAGPSFTPSDFGWSSWKAGHYWYDLDIPAQSGYGELAVSGLADKAEQWTAVAPFALDLAKLAYIGQPGQGRWSNEPVKGAVFTLTETTDASGSTIKPDASPRTVTTDANGAAHLLDGTIGATGDRWFRLAETKAPASYEEPGAGTYWMVHVKGGADKAAVTVSGSNAEAKALLKGLDGSTVTVGDRLVPGAMMPMTGGRFDVARVAALAGVVTLGLLIAGCWNLRRRDTDPVDR